jgi:hypothetical protein
MAVTVTDNRTILYQDGLTNITGASTDETGFFAEASGSAAEAYNIATGQIYFSGTHPTYTTTGNELIYVWSAIVATQNGYKEATAADSSHALYIGDGTNNLIIYQAGNDRAVFKHSATQVSFECMLVDVDYLGTIDGNGDLAALTGTYASFAVGSINRVGAHYTTLSKALGGGNNTYLDIIRYGGQAEGIQITGGTTGDRGTFSEISVEDRSTATIKAHGIIREYTAGAYGCQGTIRLGDTATGTSYFESINESVTFEGREVGDDKFALFTDANSTGTNVVILTNAIISTAGPGVTIDFSAVNMNELTLTGCVFNGLRRLVSFPTDANGTTRVHSIATSTFNNCDQIDPGNTAFTTSTISNYDSTIASGTGSGNGAVRLDDDGSAKWSDLTFNSVGTGHAIYIPSGTTETAFTFDNFSFTGYSVASLGSNLVAASGSTDAMIYNDAGGAITITIVGGNSISVRNGTGATTTVLNAISITLTGMKDSSEVRVYEAGTSTQVAAAEDVGSTTNPAGNGLSVGSSVGGTTDARTYTFSTSAGISVDIRVFNINWIADDLKAFTIPSADTNVPIAQRLDRVYSNPT